MWAPILVNGVICAYIFLSLKTLRLGGGFDRSLGLRDALFERSAMIRAGLSKREKRAFVAAYIFFMLLIWLSSSRLGLHHLLLFLAIPFGLRSIREIIEERDIEKGMVSFLGALSARLMVEDDVLKALESVKGSVPSAAIRRVLAEFSAAMKVSCNPRLAFRRMQKIRHPYLRYVFLNIENVLESWGDARELVHELENEYISAQTEMNRGRAELQNDKLLTYSGLLLAVMTAVSVFQSKAEMGLYYLQRPVLALVLLAMAGIGVVVLARAKIS